MRKLVLAFILFKIFGDIVTILFVSINDYVNNFEFEEDVKHYTLIYAFEIEDVK